MSQSKRKETEDLNPSDLLVHRHQNSLFLSAMDFETTIFVRVLLLCTLELLSLIWRSLHLYSHHERLLVFLFQEIQSCWWPTSSLREPGYQLRLGLAQSLHTLLNTRQVGMSQPRKKSRLFRRYWGLQNVQLKSCLWVSLFAYGSRIKIKIKQEWMSTETTETSGNLSCNFTGQQKSHIRSEHRGVSRITKYPDMIELQIRIRIKISIL